jgi:hypothetical protein
MYISIYVHIFEFICIYIYIHIYIYICIYICIYIYISPAPTEPDSTENHDIKENSLFTVYSILSWFSVILFRVGYIYICVYVYIYIYNWQLFLHMWNMLVYIYIYIYNIHIYTYVHIYICICINVYMYMQFTLPSIYAWRKNWSYCSQSQMCGLFWLFIVGLFCYICIFYYLYVDSLTSAFGWSAFLCRIRFRDTPRCNLFKVNIIIKWIWSIFAVTSNREII